MTTTLRPPRVLFLLLVLSLSMCVLTAGHARDYIRSWNRVRRGKDIAAQRATMGRRPGRPTAIVPWFDQSFVEFAEDLRRAVPADADILLEPDTNEIHDRSGRARWFMYLNNEAYPLRFYVRKPAFAGGTLVDYEKWLVHHVKKKGVGRLLDEEIEIEERGIEYKLVFGVTRDFARDTMRLFHRRGNDWVRVPLPRRQ